MNLRDQFDVAGRMGRITRLAAVVCFLVACALLLTSVTSPAGFATDSLTSRNGPKIAAF